MDRIVYGVVASALLGVAWLQWYWGLGFLASLALWSINFLFVFFLMRFSGQWHFFSERVFDAWVEFNKIYWVSWYETRNMTVSVSLMIGVFSVMLWLMDQLIVTFLTYWV